MDDTSPTQHVGYSWEHQMLHHPHWWFSPEALSAHQQHTNALFKAALDFAGCQAEGDSPNFYGPVSTQLERHLQGDSFKSSFLTMGSQAQCHTPGYS